MWTLHSETETAISSFLVQTEVPLNYESVKTECRATLEVCTALSPSRRSAVYDSYHAGLQPTAAAPCLCAARCVPRLVGCECRAAVIASAALVNPPPSPARFRRDHNGGPYSCSTLL
eukprot:131482-Pleurochrysis_carterae.AAC.3